MQTDAVPFYRLSWRMALTVICPIHYCVMEDVCPRYQSPVMFHRHGIGRKKIPYVEHLRYCHQCFLDLGGMRPRYPEWPDCNSLNFLTVLIGHPELSPWRYLRIMTPSSIPFFVGLRALLRLLNCRFGQPFETTFAVNFARRHYLRPRRISNT